MAYSKVDNFCHNKPYWIIFCETRQPLFRELLCSFTIGYVGDIILVGYPKPLVTCDHVTSSISMLKMVPWT